MRAWAEEGALGDQAREEGALGDRAREEGLWGTGLRTRGLWGRPGRGDGELAPAGMETEQG